MEILKQLEGKTIKSIIFDTPQLSGDINQMHETIKIICSDDSIYEIETSLNDFIGFIVEKKN